MRGIISSAGYVPYRRLQRSDITAFLGSGGGKGTRSVASHDEDTTTMGVEAARACLASVAGGATSAPGTRTERAPGGGQTGAAAAGGTTGAAAAGGTTGAAPTAIWFATASPAYLDKSNAAAIHAALLLAPEVAAFDFGGALRSGVGALQTALRGNDTVLVVASDIRDGLPTSADESVGGDGAAALLVGEDAPGAPVIAEFLGGATVTDEFLDRWRAPGERRSKLWEERFGETRYVPSGEAAWDGALKTTGLAATDVGRVVVTGMHGRAAKALAKKLGVDASALVDDLTTTVGQTGTAHAALTLAHQLEQAVPGDVIAVVSLADGADVLLFRATEALAGWKATRPVAEQVALAADLPYGKFLAWRGMLTPEPPRRPEPQRVSATAAWRSEDWKFGFVGSKDHTSGAVHLPPSRVSMTGGAVDDMEPVRRADDLATIATYTIDRLAYSPSPPVVFAVLDFDGGGRFPVELTDVDAETVDIGDRVEMTFRRLFTADGVHDYFWKARPVRSAGGVGGAGGAGVGGAGGAGGSGEPGGRPTGTGG